VLKNERLHEFEQSEKSENFKISKILYPNDFFEIFIILSDWYLAFHPIKGRANLILWHAL